MIETQKNQHTLDRRAPFDRTCDGMILNDAALGGFAEGLGRSTDELMISAVHVEHIRTGIDPPEMSIDRERMEGGRTTDALRGNGLDDITLFDVRLELLDEGSVA